jgi:dienelactone hydrolase
MRHALLPLLLLALPAAAQERPAALLDLPGPAGLARLVAPEAAGAPLVILLPDALGEDGRSEAYVDSLLARGIATLALGLGDEPDAAVPFGPARDWAVARGHDAIGVLGFGLGGRIALAEAEGLPAAALYPGCRDLPAAEAGPALVLQGADAAAGCERLPPGLTLRLLPGAGHGWDAPGAFWPSPGPLLPDPAGGPRLRARFDPDTTLTAAEAVADWFEHHLAPRHDARLRPAASR